MELEKIGTSEGATARKSGWCCRHRVLVATVTVLATAGAAIGVLLPLLAVPGCDLPSFVQFQCLGGIALIDLPRRPDLNISVAYTIDSESKIPEVKDMLNNVTSLAPLLGEDLIDTIGRVIAVCPLKVLFSQSRGNCVVSFGNSICQAGVSLEAIMKVTCGSSLTVHVNYSHTSVATDCTLSSDETSPCPFFVLETIAESGYFDFFNGFNEQGSFCAGEGCGSGNLLDARFFI